MAGRKTKVTIDTIREEFNKRGATLVTKEYLNCHQLLQFKCSKCGAIHAIAYRNFKAGVNSDLLCRDCMKSVTISDIKKEFKKSGAVLLSKTFDTVDTPLEVSCASCKEPFTITWANYKAGHNKELLCSNCRKFLGRKTFVDGKIKTSVMKKENSGKKLYQMKLKEYEKGFLYIPLYPNEKDSKIIRSMIANRNGNAAKRIYARDCAIEILKTGKEFLKENHIQGYRKAAITLGLYFEDSLVMVMSFDKSRFNKNYEYELIRLATLQGYEVVGGASKLFAHFIKDYSPDSIISYCDVRFCVPDPEKTVYSKLGFKFLYKTESNYRYWTSDLTKSYSRMACQKHRLSGFLTSYDPAKTEYQNMKDNGFIRIYDCGNYVFGWSS